MSKPKPAVRTVKRRGLAIATAVAVTSSTIATVNFAYAEETTESGSDVNISDELTAEAETPNTEAHETTAAVSSESTDETVEVTSDEDDALKAPTVDEAFTREQESIKELLKQDQNPDSAAKVVAEKYQKQVANADFGEFEFKLRRQIKQYYNNLVTNGEIQLDSGYSLPDPDVYFKAKKNLIAAALKTAEGNPGQPVDEIVQNHISELKNAGHNFGDDQSKTSWSEKFRQLVEELEKELFAEWYKPSAQDYFDQREKAIEAGFRRTEPQGGATTADNILAEAKRANFDFRDEEEKAQWENQVRSLVLAKEAKILAELKPEVLEELEKSDVNELQKEIFKSALDSAKDLAEFAKIRRAVDAEIKNPVAPFGREDAPKPEAPAVEDEAGVDEAPESPLVGQVLEATKKQAWSYVHESEYLSPGQKAKFQNDIQAAGDLKSVEDAYAEVIQAESEIHLADSKTAAVAAIEGSQFLSDAQKAAFVGAVEAASSVRQVEGLVDGALDAADLQQESAEAGAHRAVLNNELGVNSNPVVDPNKQQLIAEDLSYPFAQHRDEVLATDLAEAKRVAVAAIEGADHLTEEQKSQFKNRINDSASITAVTAVIDEAHKLADKQAAEESDKAALAEEKSQAHRIIDRLSKLSPRQKAEFKEQVDGANTGAYVAHIVERAQAMNEQHKPADDTDAQVPGQPGKDEKPGTDHKPGGVADNFKNFFGVAAGLGVLALIFGGILHSIKHFDGFGVIHEHVRNAFAKIGIRF